MPGLEQQFHEKIIRPLLRGLREEKIYFSGLLFPGLMIKDEQAHVLEFNCRFGDPETQVILPRLKGRPAADPGSDDRRPAGRLENRAG
jgi:phosphoribosylamine--glycine ligase